MKAPGRNLLQPRGREPPHRCSTRSDRECLAGPAQGSAGQAARALPAPGGRGRPCTPPWRDRSTRPRTPRRGSAWCRDRVVSGSGREERASSHAHGSARRFQQRRGAAKVSRLRKRALLPPEARITSCRLSLLRREPVRPSSCDVCADACGWSAIQGIESRVDSTIDLNCLPLGGCSRHARPHTAAGGRPWLQQVSMS
jgi:hypothetical protein